MPNPLDGYQKCDHGASIAALNQADRDRFEAEEAYQGAVLRLPDHGELTPAQQADYDKATADLETATQRYLDVFQTKFLCERSHTPARRPRLSPLQEPGSSGGVSLAGVTPAPPRGQRSNPLDAYQDCRQVPHNQALDQALRAQRDAEQAFEGALRRLPDGGELTPAQQADYDSAKANLEAATRRVLDLFQSKFLCQRRYTIVRPSE